MAETTDRIGQRAGVGGFGLKNNCLWFVLFNATAQLVFFEKMEAGAGFGFSEINFSGFSNGVYFVKLSGELIDQVFEVVLQK